jgi:hypothetical protein
LIQEVPAGEWCPFLEGFSRAHRAWLATIHVVDTGGAMTRWAQVRLKSATHAVDAALFEFLDEGQSLRIRRPCVLRIQQTAIGAVQALEIETLDGQFIRLAFRSTVLPEQLDGLAPGESPGELSLAERSTEPTATLTPATHPTAQNES